MIPAVTIIGTGNVGYHLALRFLEQGVQVLEVVGRSEESVQFVVQRTGFVGITDIKKINTKSDLYILAVPDKQIAYIAEQLHRILPNDKFIAHTSGATPSTVFKDYFTNFGVFYPLQTFTKHKPLDFEQIPICVDANSTEKQALLLKLAKTISPLAYMINDYQRGILHVAAVFVNNFPNFLFHIGHQITENEGISFDLLRPLILETAKKVQANSPQSVQTGPAKRGDEPTIQQHLQYLALYPEYEELYRLFTKLIIRQVGK